jgi:hypothetical protein
MAYQPDDDGPDERQKLEKTLARAEREQLKKERDAQREQSRKDRAARSADPEQSPKTT